jgi:hypothetical protein
MEDHRRPPIDISPDAAAHIREKGGMVMLRSMLKHGCCGGRVELVKAEVGKPNDTASFDKFDVDGLELFVERGLIEDLGKSVHIGIDELLGMKSLYVEGAEAKM